ncbi:MAG: galactonate dehydratase [Chloroflexi bacterium]|nr:galactonate dehydratase [Chloroflexota bacterium]
MKITRLEIIKVPPSWVWLRVHTDKELVGLGEPYLENHADSVIAEVRRLEPVLIGQDPTRVEKLWKAMYESGSGYVGGPVTISAISGIDIALWDLAGKAAGVPVHVMLGGVVHDRIKMYRASAGRLPWTVEPGEPYASGAVDISEFKPDEPETYREAARILVEEWGFRALKVHIGVGDGLEATSEVNSVAERFAAAREGAGPETDVAIDIHNPNPAIGRQLIEALAPHRPLFIEEPMPVERVDVLERIVDGTTATIAAGERWMGKWIFFDALSRGSISVMQPDICHAGGITECKKIAVVGEAAYAKLALHGPLSPLALAASVQVDACSPNFLIQEHNEVNDWRDSSGQTYIGKGFFREPFVLDSDGCIAVPEGSGLGIDIDDDGLEKIMSMPWSAIRG